ncbi:GGDEF domain-containing protein [Vulcaniibacterium thermophilum]|uniref:diguanylate cyclase n=1 Tax=Vulcaniibacterium thermophilum TaxID=1169913 RepID=A0A919DHI7_9GAMM|nr:GGDEF domain-containing protein [Vulcaniibacterium thermophilum]
MPHPGLLSLALAAALVLPAIEARASSFSDLLAQADALRTREPARAAELLSRLERRKHEATKAEIQYLRLLRNYRRALRGEYQEAIADAGRLADDAIDPKIGYRAALLVTTVSALNREYLVGLRYLNRASLLADRLQDRSLKHTGDNVAGTLYNEFGHYPMALARAERVLADDPDGRNRCIARQVRVRALHGLGRALDKSRDVDDAIADCASQGEIILVNAIRCTWAEHEAAKGRRREAIALLESHLPEAEATGYTRLTGEMRRLLAQYYLDIGDLAHAEAHARAILRAKGQDGTSQASVVANRVLYEIALSRRDLSAALAYYRRYADADRARLDDVKAREYAFQLGQQEIREKNQSIALLQQQNQLLRLQQEVARKSQWNTRLAIALLVLLTLSAVLWGYRGRRTQRSLRKLAETDGLTGLSNRRHFRACSEAALAQGRQRGRPVSVLLFDLDHFKQINDQCGHASGDWVLREVARVGRLHCRQADVYGRIGGEEFAMTLIDCDLEAALRVAEGCRQSIAAIDARAVACGQPVSASVGVASTQVSGYDYETLMAHADAAMYRAKVGGRNRVTAYAPLPGCDEDDGGRRHARSAAADDACG